MPNLRISNFDPEYTSEKVSLTELGQASQSPESEDPFSDFDFQREVTEVRESLPSLRISCSSANLSSISTSETKSSQHGLSHNTSELIQPHSLDEDEEQGATKEIDLTMLKVFLPEKSPRIHLQEFAYSDNESHNESGNSTPMSRKSSLLTSELSQTRKRPVLAMDPIPLDAIPARFEIPERPPSIITDKKRLTLLPKAIPSPGLHIRGPEPHSVKLKPKPLLATYSQRELEEQKYEVSTKFWQDNFEEQSFVNQIPDFATVNPPETASAELPRQRRSVERRKD